MVELEDSEIIERQRKLIKELEAQLEAHVRASTHIERVERKLFVRQAAIAIYSAGMSGDGVGFSDRTAWEAAEALWQAKPEDC